MFLTLRTEEPSHFLLLLSLSLATGLQMVSKWSPKPSHHRLHLSHSSLTFPKKPQQGIIYDRHDEILRKLIIISSTVYGINKSFSMSADEVCNINATNDAKINSEVTGAQGIVISLILQKLKFRLRIYFFDDIFSIFRRKWSLNGNRPNSMAIYYIRHLVCFLQFRIRCFRYWKYS